MFTTAYKNMNKFASKIFKHNRSGKPYAEEDSHIEGYVNPNIKEKYNLTHKTSSVDYAGMLTYLTKICRVKINTVLSEIGTVENMKASLAGAVPDGVCYKGFKTFNTKDIHNNLGLNIFHGIYT